MKSILLVVALCAVSSALAVFQEPKSSVLIAAERNRMVAHYGEAGEQPAGAEALPAAEAATLAGAAAVAQREVPLGSIVVGACAVILGYFGYLMLRDRYSPPEGRVAVSTRSVWAKPKQLLRRDQKLKIAKRGRS